MAADPAAQRQFLKDNVDADFVFFWRSMALSLLYSSLSASITRVSGLLLPLLMTGLRLVRPLRPTSELGRTTLQIELRLHVSSLRGKLRS